MVEIAPWEEAPVASKEPADALSIVVVYQETLMLDWALEHCKRVERLAGVLDARSSWWKVRYLGDPEFLFDAVQAASAADIILVSVPAFEESPPSLRRWIDGWLACRPQHKGALIALIGVPEPPTVRSSYMQEYLRAVADRGQLDYAAHERTLPVRRPVLHSEEIGDGTLAANGSPFAMT